MQTTNICQKPQGDPKYQKMRYVLYWAILVAVLAISLGGCSSTNKSKSSSYLNTKSETGYLKGVDSSKTSKVSEDKKTEILQSGHTVENSESKKTLKVEFLESDPRNNYGNGSSNDYFFDTLVGSKAKFDSLSGTRIITNKAKNIRFNGDGSIEISGNIKSLEYQESGKKNKRDTSSTLVRSDEKKELSSEQKGVDTSKEMQKTETQAGNKTKEVERTSYTGLILTISLSIVVLLAVYYLYRRYGSKIVALWPWKKKQQNPLRFDYKLPDKPSENT